LGKECTVNCPNCGREFLPVEGQKFCSHCGSALDKAEAPQTAHPAAEDFDGEQQSVADSQPPDDREASYCPWEEYEKHGLLQGLLETLRLSLFSPVPFFARLPRSGGLLVPLLFALIIETVGGLAGYLWGQVLENPFVSQGKMSGQMTIVMALLMPLILFFSIVAWSIVLRVSLFLVGGATEDFEATFRTVCYTSGPSVAGAIPIIGTWIAFVWRIYLLIIATREVHRISTGKAVVAVLLPSIACCGVIVGAIALAVLGVGLSGS
jgi:hypothetical protein